MRLDAGPGDDIAALVRGAEAESLVVIVAPGRDPLALAVARASIGPLAMEKAPGAWVNAVLVVEGADPADVDSAAAFLESARSTTGQVIELGPR